MAYGYSRINEEDGDYEDLRDEIDNLRSENQDNLDKMPSSSLSDRVETPSFVESVDNGTQNLGSNKVKNRIKQSMPNQGQVQGSPFDELSTSGYEDELNRLKGLRQATLQSNALSNFGQAVSQIARGGSTPTDSAPLYSNINSQNNELLNSQERDLDRRQRIYNSIQNRLARKDVSANNLAMRERIAESTGLKTRVNMDIKQDKYDTDRLDRLNKSLTEEIASGRTPLSIAAKNKQTVENAKALLAGELDYNNLDARQLYELAKITDRVLSGTSGGSVTGTEHLTPNNSGKHVGLFMEYVTNKRQPAHAGDFVKNTEQTLLREEAQANKQIKDAQNKIKASYSDLEKRQPGRYYEILRSHGLMEVEKSKVNEPPKQESMPAKPAPHGNSVIQGGIKYNWNGSEYLPEGH